MTTLTARGSSIRSSQFHSQYFNRRKRAWHACWAPTITITPLDPTGGAEAAPSKGTSPVPRGDGHDLTAQRPGLTASREGVSRQETAGPKEVTVTQRPALPRDGANAPPRCPPEPHRGLPAPGAPSLGQNGDRRAASRPRESPPEQLP